MSYVRISKEYIAKHCEIVLRNIKNDRKEEFEREVRRALKINLKLHPFENKFVVLVATYKEIKNDIVRNHGYLYLHQEKTLKGLLKLCNLTKDEFISMSQKDINQLFPD